MVMWNFKAAVTSRCLDLCCSRDSVKEEDPESAGICRRVRVSERGFVALVGGGSSEMRISCCSIIRCRMFIADLRVSHECITCLEMSWS